MKSDGKLTINRDFTNPGLHAHHLTLIHPSVIKSSWDSPSSNDTVACIIQDHQDQQDQQDHKDHQDHQETEEMSSLYITRGTCLETRSAGRLVDWSVTIDDQPTEEAI